MAASDPLGDREVLEAFRRETERAILANTPVGGAQYMKLIEDEMYRFIEHFRDPPHRVYIDRRIFRTIMEDAAMQLRLAPRGSIVSIYSMTVVQTDPGAALALERDRSPNHILRYEERLGYSQIVRIYDKQGATFAPLDEPLFTPAMPREQPLVERVRHPRKREADE